jgi:TctA family transporter
MINRQLDQAPEPTARDSAPWLRRAWVGVATVPLFFIIAFAVGEGIYAVMGYKPENADAPVWAVVVTSALVLAVVLIPCVSAVYYGRRAIKHGDHRGLYPAVIGAIAGLGLITLTIVSEVGNAVRG